MRKRFEAVRALVALPFVTLFVFLVLGFDVVKFSVGTILIVVFTSINVVALGMNNAMIIVFGSEVRLISQLNSLLKRCSKWADDLRQPFRPKVCHIPRKAKE